MNNPTMDPQTSLALRGQLAATVAATATAPTVRKAPRRIAFGATGLGLALVGASFLAPGAYADWTPTPVPLAPGQARAVGDACLASLGEVPVYPAPADAVVRIVERRGGWDFVLVTGSAGFLGDCLTSGRGGGASASPDDSGIAAAPDSFTVVGESAHALDTSLWESGPRAEGHRIAYGRAGELAELVIHTADRDVTATVDNGWWVAWWPISNIGPNLDFEVEPVVGATVTTSDGRTIEVDEAGWGALRLR